VVSTCMLGVDGLSPAPCDCTAGPGCTWWHSKAQSGMQSGYNQARMYRRTWMYSACEMGMRVKYWTRRSIFSSMGSRVVGRKYCDEVRNSLAALPVDQRSLEVIRGH
jgi:hypothetical protein